MRATCRGHAQHDAQRDETEIAVNDAFADASDERPFQRVALDIGTEQFAIVRARLQARVVREHLRSVIADFTGVFHSGTSVASGSSRGSAPCSTAWSAVVATKTFVRRRGRSASFVDGRAPYARVDASVSALEHEPPRPLDAHDGAGEPFAERGRERGVGSRYHATPSETGSVPVACALPVRTR